MNRLNIMLPYKLSEVSILCIHHWKKVLENEYSQLAKDFDLEWVLDDNDIDKGAMLASACVLMI